MTRVLIGVLLLLSTVLAQATIEAYEFNDRELEKRFQALTEELRCPKCQNNNIADSNAPLASDLRREVYRMIKDGEADGEIIDFMVTRYGDFVLYRPPVNETTWLLWYGPFVLLGIGVIVVILIGLGRRRTRSGGATLDDVERERLKQLLEQDKQR